MQTMKPRILSAILLASLSLASALPAADSAGDGKWESLFNGKDLSGWVPMNQPAFVVTNEVIHLGKGSG